jgi:hypothetical protein
MASLKVDFELRLDSKGYQMLDARWPTREEAFARGISGEPMPREIKLPQRIARLGGKLEVVGRLETYGTLYEIFARTARTKDGLLRFIQKFGSLRECGLDSEAGDSVEDGVAQAKLMHGLLTAYTTRTKRALLSTVRQNEVRISKIDVSLFVDRPTESFKLRLSVRCLMDGLWLQFAQATSSGANLQQCLHCNELFQIGPGTGRRLDAKFCSDKHRVAFHSKKRSEET